MTTQESHTRHPGAREALLVDDDAALRGLLSVLLQQMGLTATSARSGPEALEILKNADPGKFGILITDIRMPQMGGIELARKVRGQFPTMPILFISGFAPSMTEVENELDDLSDFLKKPFEFTTFSRTLEELLARAESGESSQEKPEDAPQSETPPYRRTG